MISAFFRDNTGFRRKVFLICGLAVMLLFGASLLTDDFEKIHKHNLELGKTYDARARWLQSFSYSAAQDLYENILKPVPEAEVDRVQMEQLALIKRHGIDIDTVRQNKQNRRKDKLKLVRYEVLLEADWKHLQDMLNEFEKPNLVIMTDLDMTPTKEGTLRAKLVYNIYYA